MINPNALNSQQIVVTNLQRKLDELLKEQTRLETALASQQNLWARFFDASSPTDAYKQYIMSTEFYKEWIQPRGAMAGVMQIPKWWIEAKQNCQSDIETINGQLNTVKSLIKSKQAEVDEASAQLAETIEASKTPEEKAAEQQKMFAQKSTKYLIIGTIGIAVVAIAILVFKKFKQA